MASIYICIKRTQLLILRNIIAIMHNDFKQRVGIMNWDDIKIFLAIAETGSVRKAADKLNVNHTTVYRRITAFEDQINARLFDREPTGFFLTLAGEEMLKTAKKIEAEVAGVDRKIVGTDSKMRGIIRVTIPPLFSKTILIEEFAKFCELYPEIELELLYSYEIVDLNAREADVALRITNDPPENLVGRKLLKLGKAIYVSKKLWQKINDKHCPIEPTWIGSKEKTIQDTFIKNSMFPNARVVHKITDFDAIYAAVKAGMGIAALSCMFGDSDKSLMRLPPGKTVPLHDIWILTHEDLRHTVKIRTFMEFTAKALLKHKQMLEGYSLKETTDNTAPI